MTNEISELIGKEYFLSNIENCNQNIEVVRGSDGKNLLANNTVTEIDVRLANNTVTNIVVE